MMTLLKKWLLNDWVDQPLEQQIEKLGDWFRTPCGKTLLEEERKVIDHCIPSLFGYHLMQMSVCQEEDLARASPIHHRFKVIAGSQAISKSKHLYTSFDSLPLESDSVDVIILHHVLEFSPNPHQILKEVNRVLIPRGHVIIVGFNPFSFFGLWKSLASLFTANPPWRYNSITKWRLLDWFKLIDLNKTQVRDVFYRIPFSNTILLDRLSFLEKIGSSLHLPLGGSYVMVARKDVHGMTPIKYPLRVNWQGRFAKASSFAPHPAPQSASNIRNKSKLH